MLDRFVRLAAVAALMLLAALAPGQAQNSSLKGYGVVLLHGKLFGPGAFVGDLIAALSAEGARVEIPEMPWSKSRMYDASYEQAMREIDAAVARLKAQGAKKIVIAGHSMGANAAIGYAARRPGLAAVMALSPGHLPETEELREYTREAVARAKQLVAAGRGNEKMSFPDRAQGWPYAVEATPRIYLSLFDPHGPAVMPRNAAAMPALPFLWLVGKSDPIYPRGPGYAYARGAKHPKSRYLEVDAGHIGAPSAAREELVAWLKSL
jgi:pimeloyl-ACP methyl ester carboxylesterase